MQRHHWSKVNPLVPQHPIYRSIISSLMALRGGCVGKERRPTNHYVGQKPDIATGRSSIWNRLVSAAATANTPSFHYVNSDQWRYPFGTWMTSVRSPIHSHSMAHGHTIDRQVQAVRAGWLPSYLQFDQSPPLEVAKEARSNGANGRSLYLSRMSWTD
ncbi:MAG: hypothetical protein IPH10_11215 [bacterium]|nr:hypothetical protein [bacterium]